MTDGEKLLIEAAAHNCEAALILGDLDTARICAEFAFFAATEAAKIPAADCWGR